MKEFNISFLFTFTLLIMSCSDHEAEDYKKVKSINTLESYEAYLTKYTESKFSDSVKLAINSIKDSINLVLLKEKIIDLYKDAPGGINPVLYRDKEVDKVVSQFERDSKTTKTIDDAINAMVRLKDDTEKFFMPIYEFNERFAEKINQDTLLRNYFNFLPIKHFDSFETFQKNNTDSTYYGVFTRYRIQEDLGIEIIDTTSTK